MKPTLLYLASFTLLTQSLATPVAPQPKPATVDPSCPGHHAVYTALQSYKSGAQFCSTFFGTTETSTATVTAPTSTTTITTYLPL